MATILTKDDIIHRIQADKLFIRKNFGVVDIGIFGSYAKDQQTPDSDIDFIVEFTAPRFDWLAGLQDHLEDRFNKKVEIVRRKNLTGSRFLRRIEQEIVYA